MITALISFTITLQRRHTVLLEAIIPSTASALQPTLKFSKTISHLFFLPDSETGLIDRQKTGPFVKNLNFTVSVQVFLSSTYAKLRMCAIIFAHVMNYTL